MAKRKTKRTRDGGQEFLSPRAKAVIASKTTVAKKIKALGLSGAPRKAKLAAAGAMGRQNARRLIAESNERVSKRKPAKQTRKPGKKKK